jgi:hypothetical protein
LKLVVDCLGSEDRSIDEGCDMLRENTLGLGKGVRLVRSASYFVLPIVSEAAGIGSRVHLVEDPSHLVREPPFPFDIGVILGEESAIGKASNFRPARQVLRPPQQRLAPTQNAVGVPVELHVRRESPGGATRDNDIGRLA